MPEASFKSSNSTVPAFEAPKKVCPNADATQAKRMGATDKNRQRRRQGRFRTLTELASGADCRGIRFTQVCIRP
jgi:hypothetical protein